MVSAKSMRHNFVISHALTYDDGRSEVVMQTPPFKRESGMCRIEQKHKLTFLES